MRKVSEEVIFGEKCNRQQAKPRFKRWDSLNIRGHLAQT